MADIVVASFGTFGVFFGLLILVFLILRHRSSLIFGIYPRKSLFYHFKYALALVVLKRLRHRFYHNSEKHSEEFMQQLDKPQVLSDNPKSYDVVSFMAANAKGQKLMISLERRRRGVNRAALYLWLPEYGLLASPNLPDMLYFTTNGDEESSEFKGNGFHIYPQESMKLWCIKYEGELKQASVENGGLVKVKLDLEFHSETSHFDYNRDLSPSVIADSIAREAWNESFYMMLKSVDTILEKRTHYEQSGFITGDIRVDDKLLALRMSGLRDHSFGTERCLSTINRYVYFALFLEDGTSMVVGNLSQPSFFLSSLKVGYICSKKGEYKPITKCNFELYSYGEKGVPPKHQNFIVHTDTGKYFVQIKVEDSAIRYVGGNWESKVYNQFVSCTVNGVQGQGITEYLYRYNGGRPEEVCKTDPEWYQRIRKFERSLSNYENTDDTEAFFF
ncbi:hypothetical protein FF38_02066 [Lucilia cuprina]|uniref:Uncharacterized protein n=1 Tax=Lucilia cuprina TaxID=7375 RepID=A0A0L0BVP8_LUCCU|nr:hypothetical protein CVS40_12878 [Lucilia cuprina]KNC23314.1 hypothetical protein FF38_02066 [Lucilia cuprina]